MTHFKMAPTGSYGRAQHAGPLREICESLRSTDFVLRRLRNF
jgi:hypothetical protein